jgi:hypothetical protein
MHTHRHGSAYGPLVMLAFRDRIPEKQVGDAVINALD